MFGAFGLQLVKESGTTKAVARRLAGAAAALCLLLLLLVIRQSHGNGLDHAIRDHSLLWPCIAGAITLTVALALVVRSQADGRGGGGMGRAVRRSPGH